MSSPSWLRDLAGAWVFYTVLPGWIWPAPRFERIARFAPWIGAVIGGLMAGLWLLLTALGWNALSVAPVVLAFGLWLTGGLHLDGLMDTADGLAAGSTRVLEAMDDSRVGASGVQALVMVLLLQLAALMRLDAMAPAVLVLAAVAGRVAPLWAMARFRYLRSEGTAAFHRLHHRGLREGRPTLLLLAVVMVMALMLQPGLLPLLVFVVLLALGAAVLVAEWLGRRLGGHTGDTYGASLMVTETLVLLLMAVLLPGMTAAA